MALSRVILGKHCPSECAGGIVLGTAVAESIISASEDGTSAAHADLEAARQEWKAVRALTAGDAAPVRTAAAGEQAGAFRAARFN